MNIGDKVLCVRKPVFFVVGKIEPEVGVVYTIRGAFNDGNGESGVLLEEIYNTHLLYKLEPGFFAFRFILWNPEEEEKELMKEEGWVESIYEGVYLKQ